jgi:hypothetical protein
LDWSLNNEVMHGVWGGLNEDERYRLLRRRRNWTAGKTVTASAPVN